MELLDVYDSTGNKTGKTVVRGDKTTKLEEHEHIAVGVIFIENSKGEFLIQKTSQEKGGEFSSTGGHITHNETPLSSIKREVEEELGINIDNEDIKELGFLNYDMPLRYMFYLKKDINIDDIKVQKEEVDYVKHMTVEEINNLIDTKQITKSHGILFTEVLKRK
jgi:NADH pyrophosphatase NudC (nudix superfamily)